MYGLSGCLNGAQYTMLATVLRQYVTDGATTVEGGFYEMVQDPDTGFIKRVWRETDPDDTAAETLEIPCLVRSLRSTERFSDKYENLDKAQMRYPSNYLLTNRDRVTNIRNAATGEVIYLDEEMATQTAPGVFDIPATIFEVKGVTPNMDPFNNHVENTALLERAELGEGTEVERVYAIPGD